MLAHPRGCGADAVMMASMRWAMGSSPRVRGRPTNELPHRHERGLIPAGAGQTSTVSMMFLSVRAHPRGCGADIVRDHRPEWLRGSSPRVRGRHEMYSSSFSRAGLIPAGAGQTLRVGTCRLTNGAHPRGCGADACRIACASFAPGSSPRVRGRRGRERGGEGHRGLIPAGAGQTPPTSARSPVKRAHPRGCGADREQAATIPGTRGSSPRVRGRLE